MKPHNECRRDVVRDALSRCTVKVDQESNDRWRFELRNGKALPVTAQLAGDWLSLLTTPLIGPSRRHPWRLLLSNARLAGGVRYTRGPHTGGYALGVDVFVGAPVPAATRIAAACDALLLGAATAADVKHDESTPRAAYASDEPAFDPIVPWLDLVRESGWTCPESAGDRDGVVLCVRSVHYPVAVVGLGNETRCRVDVRSGGSFAPQCRHALGALLLTTTGALRLVRAAATTSDGRDSVCLEVTLPCAPTAADVAAALGSLAAACEHCAQEAEALLDPGLASAYLALTEGERPLDVEALFEAPASLSQGGLHAVQ